MPEKPGTAGEGTTKGRTMKLPVDAAEFVLAIVATVKYSLDIAKAISEKRHRTDR